MERSVTNAKEMLRESVTRFLANADGREDINIEQPERHHGKNTDNSSPSQVRLSSSVASQEISSDIVVLMYHTVYNIINVS
uniref:Uncharacterized protein n=1 Tax=Setaria digitata TaxID=48799 RepID=A0A915PZ11_9BILA